MRIRWQRLNGRDGHTAGRKLLADMAGQMEILTTEAGKPYFFNGPHFSISHTQTHVFCCVSENNVGIDAENINRIPDSRILRRYCSVSEQKLVESNENPDRALLRLWILKECYAKLTGRGIGNYLRMTEFDPDDPRIQIIDGCYVAIMEE